MSFTFTFQDSFHITTYYIPYYYIYIHDVYLRESSAHPFQGFLGPKNQVCIRINGALDVCAKLETTISLSVGLL